MGNSAKRIVLYILLGLLCIHFGFVVLYASPLKRETQSVPFLVNGYIYPLFHQSWSLFVPAPRKHIDVMIRSKRGEKWEPWTNITQTLIKKHHHHLLLGGETEMLLLTNSSSYVSHDVGEKDSVFMKRPDFVSFKILERAATYYLRNNKCYKEGKDYEILLITTSPNQATTSYFKNLSLL